MTVYYVPVSGNLELIHSEWLQSNPNTIHEVYWTCFNVNHTTQFGGFCFFAHHIHVALCCVYVSGLSNALAMKTEVQYAAL